MLYVIVQSRVRSHCGEVRLGSLLFWGNTVYPNCNLIPYDTYGCSHMINIFFYFPGAF